MTAAPAWMPSAPVELLGLEQWAALPEDNSVRVELVEGVPLVMNRPVLRHQQVLVELALQLRAGLPEGLTVLPEVELVVDDGGPDGGPATVRIPDLAVVGTDAVDSRARLVPGDVHALVEILSPGTRRTDRVMKLSEYAEVGIAHYVIVDPEGPITEFVLDGDAYRLVAVHDRTARLGFGPEIALPLT